MTSRSSITAARHTAAEGNALRELEATFDSMDLSDPAHAAALIFQRAMAIRRKAEALRYLAAVMRWASSRQEALGRDRHLGLGGSADAELEAGYRGLTEALAAVAAHAVTNGAKSRKATRRGAQ